MQVVETIIKDGTFKAQCVVVKKEDWSDFSGTKSRIATIDVFKERSFKGLRIYDELVKDVEITLDNGTIFIKGTQILINPGGFGKTHFGFKKWLLPCIFDGENCSVEDMIKTVQINSIGKLKLKPEDIKVGYETFWDRLKGKKTYYTDFTKEVISTLHHININWIKGDKIGKYYVEGFYPSTLTKPYTMQTNLYCINYH